MSGRLLVVEGLDGSGKTTFSKRLAVALGALWSTTPDPELRAVRQGIDDRWSPHERPLFYAGAVLDAGRRALEVLAVGRDVVIDRYWLSTLVYARAANCALDLEEIERRIPQADATLFLTIREDERRRRLHQRGMTALDAHSLDQAARLEALYSRALDRPVSGKVIALDASTADPGALVDAALRRLRRVGPRGPSPEQLGLFAAT